MSTNGNGNMTKWVVGLVCSALVGATILLLTQTVAGANLAIAHDPIIRENSRDIRQLQMDNNDLKVQLSSIQTSLKFLVEREQARSR